MKYSLVLEAIQLVDLDNPGQKSWVTTIFLNKFCCFYLSDPLPFNVEIFQINTHLCFYMQHSSGGDSNMWFLSTCEVGRVPNPKNCRGGPRTFG